MDGSVEVVVDDTEQILERVAAVDVAKASGKVCVRVPHDTREGKRVTRVFDVVATVPAVEGLADHLVCQGVQRVVVESTSDYWRVFYYVLEERGLEVWLVNARDVKNVPGTLGWGDVPSVVGRYAESIICSSCPQAVRTRAETVLIVPAE